MKKIIIYILLFILVSACRKMEFDSETDSHFNVPVLHSAQIISHTIHSINFNLDISVCDSTFVYGPALADIHTYNVSGYSYTVNSDSLIKVSNFQNYCTALLIDQSGSYLNTDFDNKRFIAFNSFYRNIKPEDSYILSAFSKGGQLENDICTVYGGAFTNGYEESKIKDLLNLSVKTGGESCLYDALFKMTNYVDSLGNGTNRSIVAFVHNKDVASLHTISEVIANAIAKNIKINIIWFGDINFNLNQFSKIPAQTGGFSIFCNSYFNFMSAFLSLDKLLHKDVMATRYNITVSKPTWVVSPGIWFNHGVSIWNDLCYFYLEV